MRGKLPKMRLCRMFHLTETGAMSGRYSCSPRLVRASATSMFEMLSHDKTVLCFGNDFSG
jgi:hypothetical protein